MVDDIKVLLFIPPRLLEFVLEYILDPKLVELLVLDIVLDPKLVELDELEILPESIEVVEFEMLDPSELKVLLELD